jgi:type IV fimbrial biogenesis protein FimT
MRCDLRMNGKYTSPKNPKIKGFTILELMVTLGILAVVLTIAIPDFHRISSNGNLKTAARDLVADFNALRARAMAENTQYVLTFNGDNTYMSPGLPNVKSPASIAKDITFAPPNFGGGTTVTFSTRGTLTAGSVVLRNSRGSTAQITCNLAGRTYVQFNMQ